MSFYSVFFAMIYGSWAEICFQDTETIFDFISSWLDIQSRRYKIEDCFRVLKTNFSSRPVYHRKENRIKAHFLICYTALLIYRLLEVKLDRNKTHFTTEQIIETLQNMNVVNCSDMYYQACYTGSDVLDSLEQLFDLKLSRKYYQPKTLNKFKKIWKIKFPYNIS